jgi:hypothetical protein
VLAQATELQNERDEKFHKYSWLIPIFIIFVTLGISIIAAAIFVIAASSTLF